MVVEEVSRSRVASVGERTNGRGGWGQENESRKRERKLGRVRRTSKRSTTGETWLETWRSLLVVIKGQINRRWSDSGDIYFAAISRKTDEKQVVEKAEDLQKTPLGASVDTLFLQVNSGASHLKMPLECLKLREKDALTLHKPHGTVVHIHVLAVHCTFRQQGKGSILMWRYLQYLCSLPYVRRATLMCEDFLIPFYTKCGFKVLGPCEITVGSLNFIEMNCAIWAHAFMRRNSGC